MERTHQIPLPRLEGDPGEIAAGARRWRDEAEALDEARLQIGQVRDGVAAMESAVVRMTVLRLDDLARRADLLAQVLRHNADCLERHAVELDECQDRAVRASADDERAHEEAEQVTRRLGMLDLSAGADDLTARALTRRALDADQEEAAAFARWRGCRDDLDDAETRTAQSLIEVAGEGARGSAGSGRTANAVHLSATGFDIVSAAMLTDADTGGPAIAPDVESSALREILADIYTTNPNCIGDGKVGTALLHEIETGQRTFGKWHADDSAQQLLRLIDLLEEDRKPNHSTQLSAADRSIALSEAEELWDALRTPLPEGSPLASWVRQNSSVQSSLRAVENKMLTSPSVRSITRVEFEPNARGRPLPRAGSSVGKVLGGLGVVGDVLGIVDMARMLDDPVALNRYLCDSGFSSYCRLDPELNMA